MGKGKTIKAKDDDGHTYKILASQSEEFERWLKWVDYFWRSEPKDNNGVPIPHGQRKQWDGYDFELSIVDA